MKIAACVILVFVLAAFIALMERIRRRDPSGWTWRLRR